MGDTKSESGIAEVVAYPHCFVCGDKNETGLALKFFFNGEYCYTDFTADERFAGYSRLLHGGILASILDEVMIKSALAQKIVCVTAELKLRYKAPVRSGDALRFEGRLLNRRGKIIDCAGLARNQDGDIVAESEGRFVEVKSGEFYDQLTESLTEK